MRQMWLNQTNDSAAISLFGDCDDLYTEKCVALGNGGHGWSLFNLVHGSEPLRDAWGELACSGHGTCLSDWRECGTGSANFSVTPCCSCDFGFAGAGCEQLDARMCATAETELCPPVVTALSVEGLSRTASFLA